MSEVPAADRQTGEDAGSAFLDHLAATSTNPTLLRAVDAVRADAAARPAVADAVMADLGVVITEGVTEARLRKAVCPLHATPCDPHCHSRGLCGIQARQATDDRLRERVEVIVSTAERLAETGYRNVRGYQTPAMRRVLEGLRAALGGEE